MVRHRIIVVLLAFAAGAAAPARAWCEASCLSTKPDTSSHCPSHDDAGITTTISGDSRGDCPALESAKPAAAARFDASLLTVALGAGPLQSSAIHAPQRIPPHSARSIFERSTPLRI